MTFSPRFLWFVPDDCFLFTQEPKLIVLLSYSRWADGKSTSLPIFISAAESALAGTAALVPVGSAPELSHKRPEPQRSCRACGTYPRGLNAPDNNSPVRHLPTPRRYARDRPLDHRAWRLPPHDSALQRAKAESAAVDRKARQSGPSRWLPPIPPPHERPQSQLAVC